MLVSYYLLLKGSFWSQCVELYQQLSSLPSVNFYANNLFESSSAFNGVWRFDDFPQALIER